MQNSPSPSDVGLLAIRVMTGLVLFFHGAQKLFAWFGGYGLTGTAGWMESIGIPFPEASALLAGLTEMVGGIAFLSGFGQRLLAGPVAFTMLVAAFTAHTGFNAASGGMEYPLTLAVVAAGLGLTGPGRYALRLPTGVNARPTTAQPGRP